MGSSPIFSWYQALSAPWEVRPYGRRWKPDFFISEKEDDSLKRNRCIFLIGIYIILAFCGCTAVKEQPVFTETNTKDVILEHPSDVQDEENKSADVSMKSDENDDSSKEPVQFGEYDFTLCFAGDINLDDDWSTVEYMNRQEKGILDCISPELVQTMQEADVMCLNHEFTFSTDGEPLKGKLYHFRAHPDKVSILQTLGVDAVSLANNHACDFGGISLVQTMETLKNAGIAYVGAGANLEEAMSPIFFELDGKTIAIVAGSRAEKNKKTPQATETEPGILRCYEPELLKQAIGEAKEQADFCILFIHWGTEYSTKLEEAQLVTGKEYLDAGADVIIGAHPHCLQGLEYHNGKPIVYSLGNYWFNEKTMDTMLVNLHFYGNEKEEHLEVKIIPGLQDGYETHYVVEKTAQRALFDRLEKLSVNVEISDDGIVTELK